MDRDKVKPGIYVNFKADYEVSGKVLTYPDRNGYVDIQGPDEERGDGKYNEHYSNLEEEE